MRVARGGFDEVDKVAGVRHGRAALVHGTDDAMALAIASIALLHLGHDFEAASGAIARALMLNGSCATALFFGAQMHAFSGDPAVAEDYADRASRLSPFDPFSFVAHLARGFVRLRDGRYADAASHFAKAAQVNPRFSTIHACQAAALAMDGHIDEFKSCCSKSSGIGADIPLQTIYRFFCIRAARDIERIFLWLSPCGPTGIIGDRRRFLKRCHTAQFL